MNAEHPRFEDLSAHHDGEAPEWAAHVTGCASCQSRLGELAALSDAVARASVDELGGHDHGDPVARALATAGHGDGGPSGDDGDVPSGHRGGGRRRWVLAASTAAVLAISISVGAVVASKGPHQEMTRDALSGPATRAEPGHKANAGGVGAGAVIAGGDLGGIPDRAALVARVAADLRVDEQRRSTTAPGAPAPTSPLASGDGAPAQGVPASLPCEVEARGDPGDRGEVVYQATAEEAGTPAVVLAFRSAQGARPITVEMRARSDCRLLLQGAIL